MIPAEAVSPGVLVLGLCLLLALYYGLRVAVAHRERKLAQAETQEAPAPTRHDRQPCGHCTRYLATGWVWKKQLHQPIQVCDGCKTEGLLRGWFRLMGKPTHLLDVDDHLGVVFCVVCGDWVHPDERALLLSRVCPNEAGAHTYTTR